LHTRSESGCLGKGTIRKSFHAKEIEVPPANRDELYEYAQKLNDPAVVV